MVARTRVDSKLRLAVALAIPSVLAIVIPLYLSGAPSVALPSAGVSVTPTPTPQTVAIVVPTATTEPAARVEPTPTATPEPAAATAPPSEAPGAPATIAAGSVPELLDRLLATETGVFGVVMTDETGELRYERNADLPFQAASLYKLVLLADVLAGVENGLVPGDLELTLLPEYFPAEGEPADSYFDATLIDEAVTLDEALFAAGAYSSNVAARALLSITDPASLEETARAIGMEHTYFMTDPALLAEWPPAGLEAEPATLATAVAFVEAQAAEGPINITTPRDVATYFTGLLQGTVVSAEVSARIMDILLQQVVDDRFPCFLPPETLMAHKTGNLDHVVHDAGIIWGPDGPVVLVAMAENPTDDLEATHVIQRLALVAYDGGAAVPALPTGGTPVAVCFDGTPS